MANFKAVRLSHVRSIVQHALPLGVLTICLALLWPHMQALDAQDLKAQWQNISALQWIAAIGLTGLSFWAVSQYDVLAHRQLDTGLDSRAAQRSGLSAIAVSQTTGFAVIIATLVRWRMLRGFGPGVAAQVTGFVSLVFLCALAGVTALVWLILPSPSVFSWIAVGVLVALALLVCAVVVRPRLRWRGHTLELPSLRAMAAASGWASVDILAAGAAFYVLLPADTSVSLLTFLPVFCIALSAGLLSGTPGGVGPFEMTLLALTATGLPAQIDVAALFVAIFGFRLVYFALPACVAMLALMLPRPTNPLWQDTPPPKLNRAKRAETAVIRQTGGKVERIGPLHCATWRTGQALVGLFDPFDTIRGRSFFDCFKLRAKEVNRVACLYKCSAHTAYAARAAGWAQLHIADDAVLDLDHYTLDTPERSRLRRKLRQCARSNVTLRRASPKDMVALGKIDAAWRAEHGTARGGTMGRFSPGYLLPQAVFLASDSTGPIAFVSFHVIAGEWALDVMRHVAHVPDGVMHALVHAGIEAAQRAGARKASLSAVVACPDPHSAWWRWVSYKMGTISGSAGLRQFKSAFAPRWQPLYAVAPNRMALGISLLDIGREVLWPARLTPYNGTTEDGDMRPDHNNDEYYALASSSAA